MKGKVRPKVFSMAGKRFVSLVCVLAMVMTLLQGAGSPDIFAVEPEGAIVQVTVKGSDGAGILGASVKLSGETGQYSADTGEEGTAVIESVAAGTYDVSVSAVGYEAYASSVTIEEGEAEKEIQAELSVKSMNIKTSVSDGCMVNAPSFVPYDSDAEISVTVEDGYELEEILVNGQDITASLQDGKFLLSHVKEDQNIQVDCRRKSYTVTLSIGENGVVTSGNETLGGSVTVLHGDSFDFKAEANAGYHVDSVKADDGYLMQNGEDSQAVYEGSIADVQAAHIVEVVFAPNIYHVQVAVKNNTKFGMAEIWRGSQRVQENDILEFPFHEGIVLTIIPKEGYQASVSVIDGQGEEIKGADVSNTGMDYRITNVSQNATVQIAISEITYTVTGYNPLGENAEESFSVESGKDAISLPVPQGADGYKFLGWYQAEGNVVNADCTRVEDVSCAKLQDTDLYAMWEIEEIFATAKGTVNGEEVKGKPSGQWFDGSKEASVSLFSAAADITYFYILDGNQVEVEGDSFAVGTSGYANVTNEYEITAVNRGTVHGVAYTYALDSPIKFVVHQDCSNPVVEIEQGVVWDDALNHGVLDRTKNREDRYLITASDDGSGISKAAYQYVPYGEVQSMDEGALVPYLEEQGWKELSISNDGKQELAFSEAGEWVLVVKATDQVGHTQYADSTGVLFDSARPEIEVTYDKEPNKEGNIYGNDSVTAKIRITDDALVFSTEDAYSGYAVSVNGKNITESVTDGKLEKQGDKYVWEGTYTFDIESYGDIGKQVLTVTAIDKCGNAAEEYRSNTICIGKERPVISVQYDFTNGVDHISQSSPANVYSNHDIIASIKIEDADLVDEKADAYENYKVEISGIGQKVLDGSIAYNEEEERYIWTGTVRLDQKTYANIGAQALAITAVDEAGNEAEKYISEDLYIDTEAPVITAAYQYSRVEEGAVTTEASQSANMFEYSSGEITAFITMEDVGLDIGKNGFSSEFTVDIGGRKIEPENVSWENGGTVWTGQYTFDAEAYGNIDPFCMSVTVYDECGNSTVYDSGKMAIDTIPGTVTMAEMTLENDSLPAKVINFLTFGTFLGQMVELKVSYDDINEDNVEGSGIKQIGLYWGDGNKPYLTAEADYKEKSGTFIFKCPKEIADTKGNMAFSVTDFAGNVSKVAALDTVSKTAEHSYVMYEANRPVASADYAEKTVQDQDGSYWVKKDKDIVITVKDADSGINTVRILDNQKMIPANPQADSEGTYHYAELDHKTDAVSYTVRYGDLHEGRNDFRITATDNCGNELIRPYTFTVYKDTSLPVISGLTLDGEGWNNRYQDLKFGNYFNKDVEVTVTSMDGIDEMCSSGLKSAYLLFDGKSYRMELDSEDSDRRAGILRTATFTIPIPEGSVESELQISLTDRVGNTVTYGKDENQNVTTEDFGMTNMKKGANALMLEGAAPVIQSIKPMKPSYKDKAGNWWYDTEDVGYTVDVSDFDSGVRNVRAVLNGENVQTWDFHLEDAKTVGKTLKFELSDYSAVKEGKNALVISVTDNAGNTVVSEESIVYIDLVNPEVIGFRYNLKDYTDSYTDKKTKFGKYEKIADAVVTTGYGYYFKEDVEVTVIAGDSSFSSGISQIYFQAVDINGKTVVDTSSKKASVDARTEGHTTSSAVFTVPANFKGEIFAYAEDHVGNYPHDRYGEENYKSPDDTIVEDSRRHLATSDIVFTKPEAVSHTADGQDLYANDIDVSFQVTDTYSGIRTIEWTVESPEDSQSNQAGIVNVGNDGGLSGDISNWKKDATEDNLVTEMSNTVTVHNNSNDIKVTVTLTDRAGNSSTKDISFNIDKTAPVIDVSYNNNSPDAANSEYYKDDRVATITITERNFNADGVNASITNSFRSIPGISAWTRHSTAGYASDSDTYTATVTFHDDGDYNFQIGFTDLAGNGAASYETHFTMDETLPVVTVDLDNEDVLNRNYYKEDQTATITIVEHNFDPSRIKITGSGDDDGTPVGYPALGGWSSNGDTHTASITYSEDAFYTLDVAFADMAGNEAAPPETLSFYVDQSEPVITFSDVEKNMPYSGEIVPKISFTDTNYADYHVELKRTVRNHKDVDVSGEFVKAFNIHKRGGEGQIDNLAKVEGNDGIYTLTAQVTDLAGNEKKESITYSVNRFGSVYVYSDDLTEAMEGYHKTVDGELYITAYNANRLKEANLDIARDGSVVNEDIPDLKADQKAGSSGWYEYTFAIDNDDLEAEGRYEISLTDKDEAQNTRTNSDQSIWFYVDENPPVLDSVVGLETDSVNASELPVDYTISDAIALREVRVYINGEQVDQVSEFESPQDYNGAFVVPSGFRQKIRIEADDMVGATTSYDKEITVSTNPFVRWYSHTAWFWGTWGAIAIVAVAAISILFVKRRKAEGTEEEGSAPMK